MQIPFLALFNSKTPMRVWEHVISDVTLPLAWRKTNRRVLDYTFRTKFFHDSFFSDFKWWTSKQHHWCRRERLLYAFLAFWLPYARVRTSRKIVSAKSACMFVGFKTRVFDDSAFRARTALCFPNTPKIIPSLSLYTRVKQKALFWR